jgi:hypothetical protein
MRSYGSDAEEAEAVEEVEAVEEEAEVRRESRLCKLKQLVTAKTAQCKIRSYATRWTISISQESSSRTWNTDTKRVHRRSINA